MASYNNKVISWPHEGAQWVFQSFVTEMGRDVAVKWDTDQSFEAEQAFISMVKVNQKIGNYREWPSWRHAMSDKAGKAGVVELGFKSDGRQYRALCMFNGKKCIVLLCMCYHKGSVWTPAMAVDLATERAKAVATGKAALNVIQIDDYL